MLLRPAAAGDSYNLRSVLLADGTGAIVGPGLGSPVPGRCSMAAHGGGRPGELLDGERC